MNDQHHNPPPELVQGFRADVPFSTIDEFLNATEPSQHDPNVAPPKDGPPSDPPPPSDEHVAQPDSTPKPKRKGRCTKRQKADRLKTLRIFLMQNAAMEQIVAYAKQHWGIGKRSVQLYIQHVKQRWAEEAGKEDYLAHLWLSHLQHGQAIFRAFKDLERAENVRESAGMLRVIERLLRARDENMASIVEHRRATRRDTSPDSVKARHKRQGMVKMPFAEFQERILYLRDSWRRMFQEEFEKLHGLQPKRYDPPDGKGPPSYGWDEGQGPKDVFPSDPSTPPPFGDDDVPSPDPNIEEGFDEIPEGFDVMQADFDSAKAPWEE